MTRIKLCGLTRACEIEQANILKPDYVGFVFAEKSRRRVTPEQAQALKSMLSPEITAVGVFVDEDPEQVADLLRRGTIDMAQLHGSEGEDYLTCLRTLTDRPVIRAFRISGPEEARRAQESSAEYILLDSGAGTGSAFDWKLAEKVTRPYFLAGGLDPQNVGDALKAMDPFAVDVSSGIETDGKKDLAKMAAFVAAVRKG